jgi:hypothetical protein
MPQARQNPAVPKPRMKSRLVFMVPPLLLVAFCDWTPTGQADQPKIYIAKSDIIRKSSPG